MAVLSNQQAIERVFQCQQAGRLEEAESLCRQMVANSPEHPGLVHLLGVLNYQLGRHELAIQNIRWAILLNPHEAEYPANLGAVFVAAGRPDEAVSACQQAIALREAYPEAHLNLGNALMQVGRSEEAIAAYHRALALRPEFAEAHNNLGNALKAKRDLGAATASYRQALTLRPQYTEAHFNLGTALHESGQVDEAIDSFRRAVALQPNYADAHFALGNALLHRGRFDEAMESYKRAIEARPAFADAITNLGSVLQVRGQYADAIDAYHRALAIAPSSADAHANLGVALHACDRMPEAIERYRRALELRPGYAEAMNFLGRALSEEGHVEEAIAQHRQAIAVQPQFADAHVNLAHVLLSRGEFAEGWKEYEWRRRLPGATPPREFSCPQWDGQPLAGRRILIHCEQGLGDVLQFVRFIPQVVARGGRLVFECYPEMHRLFRALPGIEQMVVTGESLPSFDLHCPLLSLPLALGTTLDTIPANVPYLHPDPALVEQWRSRLGAGDQRLAAAFRFPEIPPTPGLRYSEDPGQREKNPGLRSTSDTGVIGVNPPLNVGLVWAGSPLHRNDRARSMSLAALAPLATVPGVRWFSLQKGDAAKENSNVPRDFKLIDWTKELTDFADTAALLANLDLLITVDTAPAHLAGAMAKPVWVPLPTSSDYRWLRDRDDSPWYPTMRLFRQRHRGDWTEPLRRLREELHQVASSRAPQPRSHNG